MTKFEKMMYLVLLFAIGCMCVDVLRYIPVDAKQIERAINR